MAVLDDFVVNDGLRVIVVDTGDDFLTIRYNKKNKTFRFDELPFSLAHRLATFEIPAGATRQSGVCARPAIALFAGQRF